MMSKTQLVFEIAVVSEIKRVGAVGCVSVQVYCTYIRLFEVTDD